jgi:negative regulator of flagellin synthesis FlgM
VAVTVSTLARSLEKSERSESADIDTQKVASVKAAIQDGTYVVNAEAIADQLLSNAQEMLNRSAR